VIASAAGSFSCTDVQGKASLKIYRGAPAPMRPDYVTL
jgi:hypothetical protein